MTSSNHEEKLIQLLAGLGQEPASNFDSRFWKRFKREKYFRAAFKTVLTLCLAAAAYGSLLLLSDHPLIQISQDKTSSSGQRLKSGDRIATGHGAWTIIELPHRYRLKVDPDSELVVKKLKPALGPGKSIFEITRGRVLVSINEKRKYPLEIHTMNAFVAAMGTQFTVQAPALPSMPSEINVLRGRVHAGRFSDGSRRHQVDLTAGLAAHIGNTARTEPLAGSFINSLKEQFQFDRKDQALLLISMGPERLNELLTPCILYLRFEKKNAITERLGGVVRVIQNADTRTDVDAHLAAARELENLALEQNEVEDLPLLLFCGSYYNYLGQTEDAERVFLKAAENHATSSFRSLALMAAARMEFKSEEKKAEAYRRARSILQEYPESYEAGEAKNLIQQWETETLK